MSKRAADKMWSKAKALDGVLARLTIATWADYDDISEMRTVVQGYVTELATLTAALREDGDAEFRHGQEWHKREERKAKVRREQERIRPAGPKVEEAL